MSSSSPTRSWTSAGAGSRTRPSATGAERPTRSIAAGDCSPRPRSASTPTVDRSCSACFAPGDPRGDVATAWHAKEAVRELYAHDDPELALQWVDRLAADMIDDDHPIEVRSLGATLRRWRLQIAAWHGAKVSNGPTEAMNNLIKRVKRAAFGFRSFASYRVRALLYAGRPDWSLLGVISPC